MGKLLAVASGARSSLATPEKWVVDWLGGGAETPAGVRVDEDTALHYGPFFAGVRVISEDTASLPFPVYRRIEPKGKQRDRDHRLWHLLNEQPNDMMSAQSFREALTGNALMWGGGFAEIALDDRGREVEALWPLRPDKMKVKLTGKKKRLLRYQYEDYKAGIVKTFLPSQILHIHGVGGDGVHGWSIIELARRSLGLGIAAEVYGSKFFGGDGRPSGVLTHPGVVGDTARQNMRSSWKDIHKGPDNAQRIAILEEGVTWQQIGIPPGDAQFLDTRSFEVVDMARWLRIPPHKLQEMGRATWNNIESAQIEYVTETLRTWLTRWESEANTKLLTGVERDNGLFAKHVIEGLLRGDMKSRFEAYQVGRQIGFYSADDLAELEDRNPLPDGKGTDYYVPLNWLAVPAEDEEPPVRQTGHRARSIEARRRIARSFRPLLSDVAERMARFERTKVSRLLKKHFGDRARRNSLSEFQADLDSLYEDEVLEVTVERWTPAMSALAAEIAAEAVVEVGTDDIPELDTWVDEYVAAHSAYRIGSSKGQIMAIIRELIDDPEKLVEAVNAYLDDTVEHRPEHAARWESTQMGNHAARETWRSGGVRKIRWSAFGDDCPYCRHLDGDVVGIEQTFAPAGTVLDGDDGETLNVEHDTYAPPVHPGCDCSISAG